MYLIELADMEDKKIIMENKSKLRQVKDRSVFINNDLSMGEREIQKQINRKMKEEREKGKTVRRGFNKLTIEGEVWRWNKDIKEITKSKN